MAFIVTVKLVENIVNKKVGNVMVVKVISQYRIPGKSFMRNTIDLPRSPSQELAGRTSSTVEV